MLWAALLPVSLSLRLSLCVPVRVSSLRTSVYLHVRVRHRCVSVCVFLTLLRACACACVSLSLGVCASLPLCLSCVAAPGKGAYAEPIAMAAGANTGDNTGAAPQKATSQAKRKSRPAPLGPDAVAANDDDDNEQFFTPRETPGPLRAPLGHTAPPGE